MDEQNRETMREDIRDTRGDLGGNDTIAMAEYDLVANPERRHGERRAAQESEAEETGGKRWMMARVAEGEHVDVRGAVGMTRAGEANVSGLSGITVGQKTKLTGGTPLAVASDEIEFEKGGSLLAVAGKKVEVEDHGYVGFALAPRVEVEDGGRVLITGLGALVAGLAFGAGFGAVVIAGVFAIRRRVLAGLSRSRP